jgi:hypothetical protein
MAAGKLQMIHWLIVSTMPSKVVIDYLMRLVITVMKKNAEKALLVLSVKDLLREKTFSSHPNCGKLTIAKNMSRQLARDLLLTLV